MTKSEVKPTLILGNDSHQMLQLCQPPHRCQDSWHRVDYTLLHGPHFICCAQCLLWTWSWGSGMHGNWICQWNQPGTCHCCKQEKAIVSPALVSQPWILKQEFNISMISFSNSRWKRYLLKLMFMYSKRTRHLLSYWWYVTPNVLITFELIRSLSWLFLFLSKDLVEIGPSNS